MKRTNSLYLRLLSLVAAIVVGTVVLLSVFALRRFIDASVFQLRHEAVLLSDTVKASILPYLDGEPEIEKLQAQVDRIAQAREKNDIEINIMLLQGAKSLIAASNIPDNIGRPSVYEHRDMLASLEEEGAVFFVGRDDDGKLELDVPDDHPDRYLAPGQRFVSVTRPLAVGGRPYGAINTKISLYHIDKKLGRIRRGIVIVGCLFPIGAVILMGLAVRKGLLPLSRLADEVSSVEASSLSHRLQTEELPRELKPIGERLNQLLERLEASFKRERRFTADVAHELRTPIATLKAIAQVGIQEVAQKKRPEDEMDFLQDVLEVAIQMERLVENLLALVRCESDQMRPRAEGLNLKRVMESTWELFREKAEGKGISSRFELTEAAPLLTDRALVEGMLTNLFSNSIQYTDPGGSIACSLESQNGEVLFNLENSTHALVREDLEHLTQPFWRKDEARSDSAHCGIGLCLVSAYARVLGVKMDLDLPRSDTFRVRLRFPSGLRGNADSPPDLGETG